MADSIDARTRAVDKMKAEPGKEMAAYQAAENQLLAIQAEQKQNLAMARAQSAATVQQNNMIAQAAEVAAGSGGAAQVQQVPINAATQGVLGKYGMGPTISKSTQRSTQSITRQNITINNYNTTTNNTTTNVPNTGPVQGRPVVVNRDDTGRFKVWVNNVLARQNEQAAIRDREYAKRESALSRSANKMTRKLESISGNLSEKLDPRNLNRTADGQFRMLLRLAGITAIGANWRKILGFAAGIEDKVSNFLQYFGIGTEGESKMVKDIRYMLGGKREDEGKSIISTLGETLFTGRDGKDSIFTYLRKRIENWLSARAKALSALASPEVSARPSKLGDSMKNVAEYFVNALKILMGGPAVALSVASSSAREQAVKQRQQVSDESAKEGLGYGQMDSTKFKDREGNGTNTIAGDSAIYQDLHVLSRDVDSRNRLVDTGAALRQARSITAELSMVNKKDIDTLFLLDGLRKLELTAREGKTSLPISENFLDRLSELGLDVGEIRKTLQTKKFKYINLEMSDSEKEQLGTKATHKIALVDADDSRYKDYKAITSDVNGYAIADKKSGTVTMNVLTEKSMDVLKKELAKATSTDTITFDPEDVESAMAVNNLLTSKLKRKTTKDFDNAIKRSYEALDAAEDAKRMNEENFKNSVLPDIIDRGKAAYEYLESKYNSLMSSVKKDALLKFMRTPESYQDKSDPGGVITLPDGRQFDTDAAIREMNKNKHGDSTKYCYRYTAQGIDIGLGNNTSLNTPTSRRESFLGTGEAKEAGPKLEQLGFQEIPLDTPWKKGDVIVFQPNDKYYSDRNEVGHGHIAMNVGNGKWVSDFDQGTISGNKDALNAYSDYKIYRFGGLDPNLETTTNPDKVEEVTYPTNDALTTNILKNSSSTTTPNWSYIPSRGNNDYSERLYSSNMGFTGFKPVNMNELSINLELMNNQLTRMNQTLELGVQAAADNVDATRNNGQAIASVASMSAPKPQRRNATPLTTL